MHGNDTERAIEARRKFKERLLKVKDYKEDYLSDVLSIYKISRALKLTTNEVYLEMVRLINLDKEKGRQKVILQELNCKEKEYEKLKCDLTIKDWENLPEYKKDWYRLP